MDLKILTKEQFLDYIPSLNRLFKKSFGKDIHPDFLKWRYLDNPTGELLVAVAIEDGEIIANYSASPGFFRKGNESSKTALSMTTMTDPNYNGMGLFPKLANMLYNEMIERNYSAVWGFPNGNSHGAFVKKLGWKDIYEIPTLRYEVKKQENKKMEKFYRIEFDNEYNKIDAINLIKKDQYFVEKSKKYYEWRYNKHPFNTYKHIVLFKNCEIVGSVLYKIYNNSIDILEFNGIENKEDINCILSFLHNLAIESDYNSISCWMSVFDHKHTVFEKFGFDVTVPITYFCLKQFKGNFELDYNKYFIQMGDSDVY